MTFLRRLIRNTPLLLRFIPVYLWEMTLSNLRVAFDALRPRPSFRPGFVEISLAGYDDVQRWGAACLISMTPGTLALDLPADSDLLLVHSLYLDDPETTRADLERLLRQAFGTPSTSPAP